MGNQLQEGPIAREEPEIPPFELLSSESRINLSIDNPIGECRDYGL